MFETAVKCFADSPSAALIDSVIKKIEFYGDYIIVHFRLFDIDPEGDSDRFYPEAVRIEYNVSMPPPNKTLYANGEIIVVLQLIDSVR